MSWLAMGHRTLNMLQRYTHLDVQVTKKFSKNISEQPQWIGEKIKSDILEDLYMAAKSILTLSKSERKILYSISVLDIDTLRNLLSKYGYSDSKEICEKLIELITNQNETFEKEIQKISQQKIKNEESDKLTFMLGMIPQLESADKVMKYERSLQKSIYQNLLILKKLQGAL